MKPGYAYPFFLTLSGVASATSDILQQPMIANLFVGLLVLTAAISFLGYRYSSVNKAILESLPDNIRPNFSPRPFAISCLVMAALVGGFSVLSAKASNDDGLIASAFPEIRALQQQLGIVQRDVARIDERTEKIERDTKFLKLAADQWLSVPDLMSSGQEGKPYNLRATFENSTAFVYKNIRIRIRGGEKLDYSIGDFILAPNSYDVNDIQFVGGQPDSIEICISALRGDGKHFKEIRTFKNQVQAKPNDYVLRLVEIDGPLQISDDQQCEIMS
ncbi:hypothetical protein [Mesorhizobium sp. A623]